MLVSTHVTNRCSALASPLWILSMLLPRQGISIFVVYRSV